jgi:hypothetical protein
VTFVDPVTFEGAASSFQAMTHTLIRTRPLETAGVE